MNKVRTWSLVFPFLLGGVGGVDLVCASTCALPLRSSCVTSGTLYRVAIHFAGRDLHILAMLV